MPNLKKVITRFPELFTDKKFREDVLGRITNVVKVQTKNAKRYIHRLLSKADRYTHKTLDEVDILVASNLYKDADELLLASTARYPEGNRSVNQSTLFTWLAFSDKRAHVSIQDRIYNYKLYLEKIESYKNEVSLRPAKALKIAVITAISGGYDSHKIPSILDARFDYYLFTDVPTKEVGVVKIQPLPYVDGDQTRSARFVKTNAHRLLPEYDFIVWVDANLMIVGDIYPFIEKVMLNNTDIGVMRHPLRGSLYEEGEACIKHGRGDVPAIESQLNYYRSVGYKPTELFETNVLVYNLKHKKTHTFLNMWWNEIDKRSERDQLSVNYCIDTTEITWSAIMDWPTTARNHPSFALTRHGKHSNDSLLLNKMLKKLPGETVDPYEKSGYEAIHNEDPTHKSIDIIYCVYNALPDIKKCLKSVEDYIQAGQKLIIIDDGSDEPTKKYLENFHSRNSSWTTLHRSETPSGYTKAANRGLKLSTADFSLLLNSDTIVTKGWLNKLVGAAYAHNDVGIVGPLSSAASQQSIPDSKNQDKQTATNSLPKGITPDKMNGLCEDESRNELMPRVPLIHGFCFGIKREVIDKIGYFDEESFPRGYGEENDYCFRAADAGFGLLVATNTYIYHAKSKSYVGPERIALMDAGMKALVKKHGQHRISRSVVTMEKNPYLKHFREIAAKFYSENQK